VFDGTLFGLLYDNSLQRINFRVSNINSKKDMAYNGHIIKASTTAVPTIKTTTVNQMSNIMSLQIFCVGYTILHEI